MSHPENKNLNPQSSSLEPDSDDEINLLDLLMVLAKHWKMLVVVPFVVAVLTAAYTLSLPNIYTAKTMIIPSDNDSGGMGAALMSQLGGLAGLAGGSIGSKSTSALHVTMLKSDTIKDPIIDKFKLMELSKAKLRSSVYASLGGATNVSLGKTDGVITISVSDKDPKLAADLANEYVEQLGRLTVRLNMSGAGTNRMFLEKRIAAARIDLGKAEDNLKEFQARNKTVSVTDQAKATIEGVAQLRGQLALKEVELSTLQRQLTDNSQEVKTAKSTVASLRSQIAGLEGKGGVSSSSIPNLGAVPQLGQEYLRLMREFKIQETLVELLTKQYEMSKLSESKDLPPFQILENAKVPERKSKPARAQIVMLSTATAFFCSIFLAFIREYILRLPDQERARWRSIAAVLPFLKRG